MEGWGEHKQTQQHNFFFKAEKKKNKNILKAYDNLINQALYLYEEHTVLETTCNVRCSHLEDIDAR